MRAHALVPDLVRRRRRRRPLHADFKLEGNGEDIAVYDADGAVVDTLSYGQAAATSAGPATPTAAKPGKRPRRRRSQPTPDPRGAPCGTVWRPARDARRIAMTIRTVLFSTVFLAACSGGEDDTGSAIFDTDNDGSPDSEDCDDKDPTSSRGPSLRRARQRLRQGRSTRTLRRPRVAPRRRRRWSRDRGSQQQVAACSQPDGYSATTTTATTQREDPPVRDGDLRRESTTTATGTSTPTPWTSEPGSRTPMGDATATPVPRSPTATSPRATWPTRPIATTRTI
jgi:hypothetical protein